MGFVYMRHHRICVLSRLCFSAFNKQGCVACMYVCMCPLRLSACVCETAAGMCILVPAHCLRVRAEAALCVRVCVCAHVFFCHRNVVMMMLSTKDQGRSRLCVLMSGSVCVFAAGNERFSCVYRD